MRKDGVVSRSAAGGMDSIEGSGILRRRLLGAMIMESWMIRECLEEEDKLKYELLDRC